ncbi:MAG: ABC transporter ATP-binding protein, partial [Cyclobacteriaceae bacterium]|nr:ABC transporter ATP-binding protein [Cyclobacteriaceae bacterium]
QNATIINTVRARNLSKRIIKHNNKFIRKVDPIYITDTSPENLFDFRATFYSPQKYFIGANIDTLLFNLSMIWLMSIFLFITLYYDLLHKIINFIESIGRPSRRKRF